MMSNQRLAGIGPKTLQYFIAVADMKSFSRAAENLRITQPALSRQIKRLEDQLGALLLVRNGRGAQVTPAGERVYDEAIAVQRQLNRMSSEIAEESKTLHGSVVIAITPTAEHAVPDIIGKYLAANPRVELTVRHGYSDSVRRMIELGHADIGVFPLYADAELSSRELVGRKVLREPECFVGARGVGEVKKFKDIANVPLILPPRGNGLRAVLEAFAARKGIDLKISVEVEGADIVKSLAVRGVGCTFLPMRLVAREVSAGTLRVLQLAEPRIERTFVVAYSRRRGLTRAGQPLFDLIYKRLTAAAGTKNWINSSRVVSGIEV